METYTEQPTIETLKNLIEYMDEGDCDIGVVRSELVEIVLRMTGEYWCE